MVIVGPSGKASVRSSRLSSNVRPRMEAPVAIEPNASGRRHHLPGVGDRSLSAATPGRLRSRTSRAWQAPQFAASFKPLWRFGRWPKPAAASIWATASSSWRRGLTPRSSGAPTAGRQARAGCTRTFSPARAWRPAAVARLARTLGRTNRHYHATRSPIPFLASRGPFRLTCSLPGAVDPSPLQ